MSTRNVVDSSGWLEYLADTPRASLFSAAIEDVEHLVVPTISIYEVFKKVLRERGENDALQVASLMQAGMVVDFDISPALEAGRHALPLADSIIYATALRHDATPAIQNDHFRDLPGVRYFSQRPSGRRIK